ncbi:MAG: serine/threonine kinase [Labilithrix sp.]|nr:serine/threonine kinase [Labilithrix sp.]
MLAKPSRRAFERPRAAEAVSSASSLADRALVQQRLGTVYGLLAVIVLGLWIVSTVGAAWSSVGPAYATVFAWSRIAHLVLGVGFVCAWVVCRRGPQPHRLLAGLDLSAMCLVSVVAAVSVSFKHGVHAELMGVIAFALVTSLRAALVPTSPRWTLCVVGGAALPVPLGIWFAIMGDTSWNDAVVNRHTFVLVAVTWTVGASLAAIAISRVMYGLRNDVREAMRLGPYTLEEKIGEGGMGEVYRARHALLRRPTAVKLLASSQTEPASVWRFEREAQITSGLTHPNTVAIYDFGRTRAGVFYYAMELLEGTTLQDLVQREGPQCSARTVHILEQITGALAEAHRAGLVHRDVKPANVMLCERGGVEDFVKVLDFGLVKDLGVPNDPRMSLTNAIKGTPHYMAPETVLHPESVDARVDIYALGGVGYHLLTGRPPFEGDSIVEICSKHLHVAPTPPSRLVESGVPEALERLILRCLAKRAEDRPTAEEVAAALTSCRPTALPPSADRIREAVKHLEVEPRVERS